MIERSHIAEQRSCADAGSDDAHLLASAFAALRDYVRSNRIEDREIVESVRTLGCQLCINAGGAMAKCRALCDPMKKPLH